MSHHPALWDGSTSAKNVVVTAGEREQQLPTSSTSAFGLDFRARLTARLTLGVSEASATACVSRASHAGRA